MKGKLLKFLRNKKEFTGVIDGNKNVFLIPDDKSAKTLLLIEKI